MIRRKFIKESAIIGAISSLPGMATIYSGMYAETGYRTVHKILSAGATRVGTLPIMRAFAGDETDYVSPFVLFDEFGPVDIVKN